MQIGPSFLWQSFSLRWVSHRRSLSLPQSVCVFFFLSLLSLNKIFSGKDKIWRRGGQKCIGKQLLLFTWKSLVGKTFLAEAEMISYENTKANKQTKTLKSSTPLMTSQLWWASLVVQAVRNPPATWKTWVRSLGWEDPLEEGMAIDSSIFAWTIPKNRGALEVYSPWGHTELDMTAAT